MTLKSERPIEVACEQLDLFWRPLDFGRKYRRNFGEDVFLFFFGDHLISARKIVEISEKTFFFEIKSFFGPKSSIFSVDFGVSKTTIPSHLSCPRAHVMLSAPLGGS